jgi:hypothetical protein
MTEEAGQAKMPDGREQAEQAAGSWGQGVEWVLESGSHSNPRNNNGPETPPKKKGDLGSHSLVLQSRAVTFGLFTYEPRGCCS